MRLKTLASLRLLVVALSTRCAQCKKGSGQRRAQRAKLEAADRAAAAAAGEQLDPLGYYRFSWRAPGDSCGTEMHADYDGTRAWNWGLDKSQHVSSAAACCAKCRAHARCNSWVFCPEPVCFAPDAHKHTFGECWLKDQRRPEAPSVNMRGSYTAKYRARHGHHHAPAQVHWISGAIRLTRPATNGTWSGRAVW